MSQKLGLIAIAAVLIALASAVLLSASPAMAFFTADTAAIMPASMIELMPDKPFATMVLAMPVKLTGAQPRLTRSEPRRWR